MWLIVLTAILVAFASGLSIGTVVERDSWESALKEQLDRIDRRLMAARRTKRVHLVAGRRGESFFDLVPAGRVARGPVNDNRTSNAA